MSFFWEYFRPHRKANLRFNSSEKSDGTTPYKSALCVCSGIDGLSVGSAFFISIYFQVSSLGVVYGYRLAGYSE